MSSSVMFYGNNINAVSAYIFICLCPVVGLIWALINAKAVAKVSYDGEEYDSSSSTSLRAEEGGHSPLTLQKIRDICKAISDGANSFLAAEYKYCFIFITCFAVIILILLGVSDGWAVGGFSTLSFFLGACTSILSGFIGMRIAVFANGRTALKAIEGVAPAFVIAIKAGIVMGFALVSLALLVLFVLIVVLKQYFCASGDFCSQAESVQLFESIAGFGLGGSTIALFGRVGGGIFTKAADVGADLVGKVEKGIPEDDPRNPAVIADNVGDNVGDIAGMGADLFGSLAESTCATLVVMSNGETQLSANFGLIMFPLLLNASGIITCLLTSMFATYLLPCRTIADIEPSLKRQLILSTFLQTPVIFAMCYWGLPSEFYLECTMITPYEDPIHHVVIIELCGLSVKYWQVFLAGSSGIWAGLIIGLITEYFTSHSYSPVRDVADSCKTGAATDIIYGLALGYKSVIIPIVALSGSIYLSWYLCGMFGVAVAALGILNTLCIGLTIDAYGPISDNAGGIAEMAELGENVREITDALDAAGNTTAAIGKGFAIGSAAMVSLALFGAFVTRANATAMNNNNPPPVAVVDIMEPLVFCGLLCGAMLPYWFSAMTMKSVGKAANAMVEEVRYQFKHIPGIMEGTAKPDYKRCVAISTQASLREMIAPGMLVMLSPIVVGFFFGTRALCGLLIGALTSGVQMAISMSNTGGAWDNAKKYIEAGAHGGKGTDVHKAAVVGDTVGDPLKDTSGPSLNILIKLMAIISLVFCPFFVLDSLVTY
eukprot:gnl/Hemi2/8059_TR2777_c0_g1_i1.p1 gnl/Hemi2/8059_TR2777_c0_g1~~gnl/Hemi2/8059_TR2777_c0_g1_i1.p1  ORF type:complete len:801 (-),score=320.10 gnl/Hemi2/8059_TR2777_c0_g1_i1:75-2390(-)